MIQLCQPLLTRGADGIEESLAMMESYLLSKDDLDTICSEMRLNDIKVDGKVTVVSTDWYTQIDPKVFIYIYFKRAIYIYFKRASGPACSAFHFFRDRETERERKQHTSDDLESS
jgi:hypothetical protein